MVTGVIETEEFMDAIRSGNTVRVYDLLRKGANVNARDFGGSSALMYAAEAGFVDIVRLLIKAGADVQYSANGSNALTLAEISGQSEIAELLHTAGASD